MLDCSNCGHANPAGARFCESCGTAVTDARIEESAADAIEAEFLLEQARSAKGALLAVAIFSTIGAVAFTMMAPESQRTSLIALNSVLVIAFWALWFMCGKRPFAASAAALGLYGGVIAYNAYLEPATLTKGFVIKGIIIAVLVRAVMAGLKHRQFVREKGLD